jgi:Cu-Zn family superoxide dismutase
MKATILLAAALGGVALMYPRDEKATATLKDGSGRELGEVTLTQTPDGIQVEGVLEGLPDGEHGFHLHMTGRCEPTFRAAGAHWNPTGRPHGQHFGDLPNITAKDGKAKVAGATPGGTLRSGEHPLLDDDGAAVIVHAGPDDRHSQPSGNSGDPIACGVVSGGEPGEPGR